MIGRTLTFAVSAAALVVMSLLAVPLVPVARAGTVFEEDWESPPPNGWSANGDWEIGVPTAGPSAVISGMSCAGTNIDGDYSANSDARLESPSIDLPLEQGAIRLKFWHWYSFGSGDAGRVLISNDSGVNWTTITDDLYQNTSPVWTQACLDLSAYAGQTVHIAFHFTSDYYSESSGWYIDDIRIVTGQAYFENPEGFESGVGDWCADSGQWQVGTPTSGPGDAHTGDGCAGTVLAGDYTANANSRLVSPPIVLIRTEPGAYIDLFFWHWFSFGSSDRGQVQISVGGGVWQELSVPGAPFMGMSGGWAQGHADLTAYAGSVVQVAFQFTSDGSSESSGWYIDDLRIDGIVAQTGMPGDTGPSPPRFSGRLLQSSPNPCDSSTAIGFYLPESSEVALSIYNARGQLVKTLVVGVRESGQHEILWDGTCDGGRAAASGVYLYRITTAEFEDTGRLVLLK